MLSGKTILVTGACGTVGRELVRQLVLPEAGVAELIGIDNNESELLFLEQSVLDQGVARFFLADVRDRARLVKVMKGVDVVFHAAAFKHVLLCERAPIEAVQTNILGVQNVVSAASECGVERVLFTSSDKAVNPTSVMGTSKLMGERLVTAANSSARSGGPVFASTRFGNVLGSRGSVIPIFREQIRRGGPVTLTDREMTRFIMSIEQAVRLVIDSAALARGGEVFITKMPVIAIEDLARAMVDELAPRHGYDPTSIEIVTVGAKPGEKMYEELMSLEETRRAVELPDYFAVLPAYRGIYRDIDYHYPNELDTAVANPYNSADERPLTSPQLIRFLHENSLFEDAEQGSGQHPASRYWPEEPSKEH